MNRIIEIACDSVSVRASGVVRLSWKSHRLFFAQIEPGGAAMEKTLLENQGLIYEIQKKDDQNVEIICQKYPDIRWTQSAIFVQSMIEQGVFKEVEEDAESE